MTMSSLTAMARPFVREDGGIRPLVMITGVVTKVWEIPPTQTTPGQPSTPLLALLFDVAPDVNIINAGGDGNSFTQLPYLQAGTGSLAGATLHPSGMFFVPEVGSHVLLGQVNNSWVILGCLTGPIATRTETAADNDTQKTARSYQPGVGVAKPRADSPEPQDRVEDWAGPMEAGDVLLAKGDGRVHLGKGGVRIGGAAHSQASFGADGQLLIQSFEYTFRAAGLYESMHMSSGPPELSAPITSDAGSSIDPKALMASFTYFARVLESNPYPKAMTPYVVRQEGFISKTNKEMGRNAPLAGGSSLEASVSLQARKYAIIREAVLQPLLPELLPDIVPDVLAAAAAPKYEFLVEADGSFHIYAGNRANAPNRGVMFLQLDFDAVKGTLELLTGEGSAVANRVELSGLTPADGRIEVDTASVLLTAKTSITVEAPTAKLTAHVLDATVNALATIKATAQASLTATCGPSNVALTPATLDVSCGPAVHMNMTPATLTLVAPVVTIAGTLAISGSVQATDFIVDRSSSSQPPLPLRAHVHSSGFPGTPTTPPL